MSRSEKIIGCYMKSLELFRTIEYWERHKLHLEEKDGETYAREYYYTAYSAMLGELYITMREIIKYIRKGNQGFTSTLEKAMDKVSTTTSNQIAHKAKGFPSQTFVSILLSEYIILETYKLANDRMKGTQHEDVLNNYFKYLPFSLKSLEKQAVKELERLESNAR